MNKASELITNAEQHCAAKVTDPRLRFHLVETLHREIEKFEALQEQLKRLLSYANPLVIDNKTHKPVQRKS